MAFVGISLERIKELLCALHRHATNDSNNSNINDITYVADYPGILASELFSPNRVERSVFILIVSILFVLSMCGNTLTIFVNIRRKIRPFFRACLISLALSDLLNTFFLSTTYMSQFTSSYVQIWYFGSTMCNVVPFATTSAILVSSMTLVAIAVDRYFAVRINSSDFWNPNCVFSLSCMLIIWIVAIIIASPVFFIYNLFYMYILNEAEVPTEGMYATTTGWQAQMTSTNISYILVDDPQLVAMCVSNKDYVGLYYAIVFGIIFMPCIVAFIWLNTIIAKTIWVRRLPPSTPQQKAQTASNTKSTCAGSSNVHSTATAAPRVGAPSASTARVRTTREARHIRMFVILILMMFVFLLCRLPAWVLLLLRMYNTLMTSTQWMLYFSFGTLNLISCVLNPLFYTFLAKTIEYVKLVKGHVFNTATVLRLCCIQHMRLWRLKRRQHVATMPSSREEHDAAMAAMPTEQPEASYCFSYTCGMCGMCGLLHAKLRCARAQCASTQPPAALHSTPAKSADNKAPERSQERDEGVECNDECDYEASSGVGGRQEASHIYTISTTTILKQ